MDCYEKTLVKEHNFFLHLDLTVTISFNLNYFILAVGKQNKTKLHLPKKSYGFLKMTNVSICILAFVNFFFCSRGKKELFVRAVKKSVDKKFFFVSKG